MEPAASLVNYSPTSEQQLELAASTVPTFVLDMLIYGDQVSQVDSLLGHSEVLSVVVLELIHF